MSSKTGEELWDEFKILNKSLSEKVGQKGAKLLMELVLENKKK